MFASFLSQCTFSFTHWAKNSKAMTHQRFTHRAPDLLYLEKGLKHHSEYRMHYEKALFKMQRFPHLLERYFQTAAVMKCKNLMPFVHAQSSLFTPFRVFAETFGVQSPKYPHYRYWRQPEGKYSIEYEQLKQKIEAFVAKHGAHSWTPGSWNTSVCYLDADPELRSHLVSVSYCLSEFTLMESANYFTFENRSILQDEQITKVGLASLEKFLKIRGKQKEFPKVASKLKVISEQLSKAPIGNLFLIGIPKEKLTRYVYDAKAFGIPTGQSMRDMCEDFSISSRSYCVEEGGLQARLLLYRETMRPDSGIEVVFVNDAREVSKYCQGWVLKAPQEVATYAPFFKWSSTSLEDRYEAELQKALLHVREPIDSPS